MSNIYDDATDLNVLVKQPWEETLFDIPFDDVLRDGDTISSVVSVTFENMGEVVSSGDITIAANPANSDTVVQPFISGGDDMENYKVTARVITLGGDKREVDVMLYVRDL